MRLDGRHQGKDTCNLPIFYRLQPIKAQVGASIASACALEALSSGESIIFVQEPFGLFCHKDAQLFPLEGEGDPEPSQMNIRDVDLQIERLFVDPRG